MPSDDIDLTPEDLKAARSRLGLSAAKFARVVKVQSGRTVQKWEGHECDIPGPVKVLVDLLLNVRSARKRLGLSDPRD